MKENSQNTNSIIFDNKKLIANHTRSYINIADKPKVLYELISKRMLEKVIDANAKHDKILEVGARNNLLEKSTINKFTNIDSYYKTVLNYNFKDKNNVLSNIDSIPFKKNYFDLCFSLFSLHTVNNLPEVLIRVKEVLKPNGFFVAAFPGANSLKLLKKIFIEEELRHYNKITPRFIPLIELKTLGSLISKIGFRFPVTDRDTFTIKTKNTYDLMTNIRDFGESNSLAGRKKEFTSSKLLNSVFRSYEKLSIKNNKYLETEIEVCYLAAFK